MFSQATEYALRSLTEIARASDGQWVLAHDLAEQLRIPGHYLSKILQNLTRAGFLDSQRGRQGGFRLASGAEKLTVWDVICQLDDVRKLESCIMGEARCADDDACPLHAIWKDVRARFKAKLENTTLADLAAFKRTAVEELLDASERGRSSKRSPARVKPSTSNHPQT